MKKLFIISSLTALGVLSSMGQGAINTNPGGSTGVFVDVQDPAVAGNALTKIGTTATTAGFVGVGGGQVTISMYVLPVGATLAQLEQSTPVATALNSASGLGAGTFNINSAYNLVLPGGGAGAVAGWNGTSALDVIFSGAGGNYFGWSAEATGITAATGIATPTAVFGSTAGLINSFVLTPVPEPSTIVLGGLGAAALLAFRRRK